MTAEQNVNKTTINNLQSSDSELVNNTLNELAESGNAAYVPFLIELLHGSDNDEIKKRVVRLLAELKHSDAIPMIIDAIKSSQYAEELQFLVSACWENGLDYSDHLSLFIELMLEQDFMVAFEAHTVITNMTGKISSAQCETEINRIEAALPHLSEEKRGLLIEIIDFLPLLEAGIEPQSY